MDKPEYDGYLEIQTKQKVIGLDNFCMREVGYPEYLVTFKLMDSWDQKPEGLILKFKDRRVILGWETVTSYVVHYNTEAFEMAWLEFQSNCAHEFEHFHGSIFPPSACREICTNCGVEQVGAEHDSNDSPRI